MPDSQAELFARSFQSQVARNPGAACLTLPVLRALGVKEAVNGLCASEHVVAHGQIIELLVLNACKRPSPCTKSRTGWRGRRWHRPWVCRPHKPMIPDWARHWMLSSSSTRRSGRRWS